MLFIDLNALCRVLGINHPGDQPTCIGYCKTGRQCRNLVAGASRRAAEAKLVDICLDLSLGMKPWELEPKLLGAAELLHCKRWHRVQAPPKTKEWSDRLVEHVEQSNVARHLQPSPHSSQRQPSDVQIASPAARAAISPFTSIRDRDISPGDTTTRILNDILARLDRLESQTETLARLESQTAILARYVRPGSSGAGATAEEHPSTDEGAYEEDEGYSSSTTSDRARQPDLQLVDPRELARKRLQQRFSSRGPITSSSSSNDRASSSSSSSQTGAAAECGICLSQLPSRSRGDIDVWRCTTCHNATHAMCFDEWVARSAPGLARCIYCRSPLSTD